MSVGDELKTLLHDYDESYEVMARELRRHPAFSGVDRVTLYRWVTKTPTPKRAHWAVRVLRRTAASELAVPVALARSAWVLPAMLLARIGERPSLRKALNLESGISTVELPGLKNGPDALAKLANGEAQIAFAMRQLGDERSAKHRKLCRLTRSSFVALSEIPIRRPQDLYELRIGHPPSAVALQLFVWSERWGLNLPPTMQVATESEAVDMLIGKKIDSLVAWEPYISDVHELLKKRRGKRSDREWSTRVLDFVGPVEVDVFINPQLADPTAIRRYLGALRTAAQYVDARRTDKAFLKMASEALDMPPRRCAESLANTRFEVDDLDAGLLLELWTREIGQLEMASHEEVER